MAIDFGSDPAIQRSLELYVKLASTALLLALVVTWPFLIFFRRRKLRLPPGPFPFPIIGNLHMMGQLPHRALAELCLKYGPLMSLRLGSALTLVVSSPDMAKEFLKTHDLFFASRPTSTATKYLWYNSSDITFSPYGRYWRAMRKLCVLQLLSSRRIDSFCFIREEEVSAMIRSIHISYHEGFSPMNISKAVSALGIDIICRIAFSRKYTDQQDILSAGSDTSSVTIEWAMSELLRNPPVMKKLQEELERVAGMGRMVQESDLPGLVYLQSVVKETLRPHQAGPLSLPHISMERCNVLGYEIPSGTQLLVNIWAIGRNPKLWGEDAESFKLEKITEAGFLDTKVENFEWIPFGAGRRRCPGQQLGLIVVEFAVAQLLHCFNWRLPDDMNKEKLDMSEKHHGITVSRANELFAVPTPRFPVTVTL